MVCSQLPRLEEPVKKQANWCPKTDLCSNCPFFNLNGGFCDGCKGDYIRYCLKNYCDSNCNECGGGKFNVVACCGRSPLRDEWAEIVKGELPQYNPPPTEIYCRLIPVIYGQVRKFKIPEQFPQIDTWAVPVHKSMDLKGKFRSADLKDYLGLSSDRKLILYTAANDKFMEMLWEQGESIDYQKYGLDYWFPANFSIYDDDCRFYQLFNAKRMQIHAMKINSQFVWFQLGHRFPIDELFNPVRKASSIILYGQGARSSSARKLFRREAEIAAAFFPLSTKFFLAGEGGLKDFPADRVVYRIVVKWMMRAYKGRDMSGETAHNLSRKELLINNLTEALYEYSA